jgi:hypothetical protein
MHNGGTVQNGESTPGLFDSSKINWSFVASGERVVPAGAELNKLDGQSEMKIREDRFDLRVNGKIW